MQHDVAPAVAGFGRWHVLDCYPCWVDALPPDNFAVILRIQADRRRTEVHHDLALAIGYRNTETLPRCPRHVPPAQCGRGDSQIPPRRVALLPGQARGPQVAGHGVGPLPAPLVDEPMLNHAGSKTGT